jgi:phage-related protein
VSTPAVEFTVVGVDKASKTFTDVGAAAERSSDKIRKSSADAASSFEAAGDSAGDLATWTATLGDGMATLGEQIGGSTGRLLEMGGNAILAGTAFGDLGEGAVQAAKWIGNLGIVQKAQAAWTGVVTAAQWAWNAAMNANPIGLIILAIAAVIAIVVLLVKNWDTVSAAATAAWEWIKGIWSVAWAWLDENVVQPIKKFFALAWEAAQLAAQMAWEWVKGIWAGAWAWLDENVVQPIKKFFALAWEAAQLAASRAWEGIKGAFAAVAGWFRENVTGPLSKLFSGAWDGIKSVWNGAKSFFTGIGDGIKSAFKGAFNAVARFWNNGPGRIGFTVPKWVPGVGGRKFDIPNIPLLAKGGDITRSGWAMVGEAGPEMLKLPTGARVQPLSKDNGGPGGGVTINITNHYPQAEPTSVTTNKALQYAAALGV